MTEEIRSRQDRDGEPMQRLSADNPLMIAWKAYQETPAFKSIVGWAGKSNMGSMWGVYVAGFEAGKLDGQEPMKHLASALSKFAPDLCRELVDRKFRSDTALIDFVEALRKSQGGCPHCGYRHPPDGMCV